MLPLLILLNWLLGLISGSRFTWNRAISTLPSAHIWDSPPSPPVFPRFEDSIVLTVRTSATTLMHRLPLMLLESHTLPRRQDGREWEYIPNLVFYSDADTWIGQTHFVDILRNVSSDVKSLPEFNSSYSTIQSLLRTHQDPSKLVPSPLPLSGGYKGVNKGWLLDKWKFLPLHGDAYRRWPEAKWHVGIEDDTYLFWNQLVKWLKTKPQDEQKYYGAQMYLVVSKSEGRQKSAAQSRVLPLSLSPSRVRRMAPSPSRTEEQATQSPAPSFGQRMVSPFLLRRGSLNTPLPTISATPVVETQSSGVPSPSLSLALRFLAQIGRRPVGASASRVWGDW